MDFWNASWENINPERIADYLRNMDLSPDGIIKTLHQNGVRNICDAGCGCGAYARKLVANGFTVSGFDIAQQAVKIAAELLAQSGFSVELKAASVLHTGYADGQFDAVVCRDVLDHIHRADAILALEELCRITKPGGIILFTLDCLDEEYESQPHQVNTQGDFLFTDGKWAGMVFHPYHPDDLLSLCPAGSMLEVIDHHGELTAILRKR